MKSPKFIADHKTLIVAVLTFTLARTVIGMTRRFAYPFAPAIGRQLEVGLSSVQSVIAAQAGAGMASPLFGTLSERFGRRKVMTAALVMMSAAALVGAIFPQFWVFALVMVVLGAGNMLFLPAMQAYLGDRVPYHRRALALGTTELSWAGSLIVAAPLTGFLLDVSNLQMVFAMLSGLCLGVSVLTWTVIPPDQPRDGVQRSVINPLAAVRLLRHNRRGLAAVCFTLALSTANEIFFINYGAFMEVSFELLLTALGVVTVVVAAAEVAGEFIVIGAADKLGKRRLALWGAFGAAVCYLLLPFLTFSLPLALVGIFIMFLCMETAIVSSIPLFTEIVPESRSVMMSGVLGAASLGRFSGAVLGGMLYAGTGSFVLAGVVAMSIGMIAFVLMWRFITEEAEPVSGAPGIAGTPPRAD